MIDRGFIYTNKNMQELSDLHNVILANASKPYIDAIHHVGTGKNRQFVIEYNHEKLVKDRKIFLALTDEAMQFYEKKGIQKPKNFEGYKSEKELVIAI